MSFLLNAIGHSRDKYYHTIYKTVDRRSEVDISILSWFMALIPMLDCIPNPAIPPDSDLSDISDFSDHRVSPKLKGKLKDLKWREETQIFTFGDMSKSIRFSVFFCVIT